MYMMNEGFNIQCGLQFGGQCLATGPECEVSEVPVKTCGAILSADTGGTQWQDPVEVTGNEIKAAPSCRDYTVKGYPEEIIGGQHVSGPCWPGVGQTWTIKYRPPVKLYIYSCGGYESAVKDPLEAAGWQRHKEVISYTSHTPGPWMWSKEFTEGDSTSVTIVNKQLVGGVFGKCVS